MCDCPLDLVLCFRRNCERAREIARQQREQYDRALRMIGDPRVLVSRPSEN